MGIGSTAKKVQKLGDVAEKLYQHVQELRVSVSETKGTVEDTNDRVDAVESELAEQRALLEAVASEQGIDVADVLAAVDAGTDGDADEAASPAGDSESGQQTAASDAEAGQQSTASDAEAVDGA